jgi:formylglycine-generating enzyme
MENHKQTLPNLHTPFTMIAVTGGIFEMGSNNWSDTQPIHPVEISDFWIGEFPVTQALWEAVTGNNPSYFKGEKRPVETISWNDIVEKGGFLEKLNGITKYTEGALFCRPKDTVYRLPTEAEWEYAARGGNQSGHYIYAGSDKVTEFGWANYNGHQETKPVGLKLANELGIYDMSGNVWEWCWDWFDSDFYLKCLDKNTIDKQPVKNPMCDVEGKYRVQRGGSWDYNPVIYCHSTRRTCNSPTHPYYNVGARLVLSFL